MKYLTKVIYNSPILYTFLGFLLLKYTWNIFLYAYNRFEESKETIDFQKHQDIAPFSYYLLNELFSQIAVFVTIWILLIYLYRYFYLKEDLTFKKAINTFIGSVFAFCLILTLMKIISELTFGGIWYGNPSYERFIYGLEIATQPARLFGNLYFSSAAILDLGVFCLICRLMKKNEIKFFTNKALRKLIPLNTTVQKDLSMNDISVDQEKKEDDLIRVLTVDKANEKIFINIEDVLYFCSDGNYIDVYTENETYCIRMTLKELELKLSNYFKRVHRSSIVNLTKVKSIKLESNNRSFKLNMTNNQEVVVSRKYQPIIKKDLNRVKHCEHFK
ncbi:LytR/AlgR family response regulator transcription factor [Paraphotobacterium marinum]|uniref:LytR/AlgR family response regulator transcription factor n=1 Tax=Paraphotobacterium marinum TaxID=1755811 RepID=UPI0039EB790B